jgi:hypothetical protein
MKLTYETGIATVIQFVFLGIMNIINQLYSIISTCVHSSNTCVSNMLSSVVFYILIMAWFGFIMFLGLTAQAKRSKRLATFLIGAEALIILFAVYNIKLNLASNNAYLSLFTSLLDIAISFWVVYLAYRLIKSGGGRVVSKRRVRRPPSS